MQSNYETSFSTGTLLMPIEKSSEGEVQSLIISPAKRNDDEEAWGKENFEVGDMVVMKGDPTLTVCEVTTVLEDKQGQVAYEVADGKRTWLVESGDQLGTVEEALTVGYIRYGVNHPQKVELLVDELGTSPGIEVHMGSKQNVLKKLFSL